jgi:dTMP kinase
MRGLFITLEGIDGAGKSTQILRLARRLKQKGFRVRTTREPGGTKLGEQIRKLLVGQREFSIAPLSELALMYAARAEHLEEVIRPALRRGECVLSDRFSAASFAYQGHGRGLGEAVVGAFDRAVCGRLQPGLTLLLDLDPRLALARALGRHSGSRRGRPRFEGEGLRFLNRVRRGYLKLAREHPSRIKIVSAAGDPDEVESAITRLVEEFLLRRPVS